MSYFLTVADLVSKTRAATRAVTGGKAVSTVNRPEIAET
jgi:hypothetical protein